MPSPATDPSRVSLVIIGRNEGARLLRCFASVRGYREVVYVDSGSTDGSPDEARSRGYRVVELDMSQPFSAARARNAGFFALEREGLAFVQFVDGDCEFEVGWLDTASRALEEDPSVAVVAGRRRERYREQTVFNVLCDIEWDTPIGFADAVGGDFLGRVDAIERAGGFDPTVIAGEEPELCLRLRSAGWKIRRIDAPMTIHDAAMTRVSEWWRRARRAGYAYALVSELHRSSPLRIWARPTRSALVYGLFYPLFVLALGVVWPLALGGLLLYPLLALRIERRLAKERSLSFRDRAAYALSCVVAKFAEAGGVLRALRDLRLGRARHIIEYKRT